MATSCTSISACCKAAPAKRLKKLAGLLWLTLQSNAPSWGELWLEHSRCPSLSLGSVVLGGVCTVLLWGLDTWLTASWDEIACSWLIPCKIVLWGQRVDSC